MKKLLIFILLFFSFGLYQTNAYDISGTTNDLISNDFNAGTNYGNLQWANNGHYLYQLVNSNDTIYRYELTTAYDINSVIIETTSIGLGGLDNFLTAFRISDDGVNLYFSGTQYKRITQLILTTPWSLNGGYTNNGNFSISTQVSSPGSLFINPDGGKIYVTDYNTGTNDLKEYSFGTNYNVNTLSFSQEVTAGGYGHGALFTPDGLMLFYMDWLTPDIAHYTLGTAWDISTISLQTSWVISGASNVRGLEFNNDYSKMFINEHGSIVRQYSTNDIYSAGPPLLTTASIEGVTSLENGVNVSFICEQDCFANIGVYNNEETVFYNNETGTYSGSLDPYNIFIPVSLLYQGQYKIIGGFYDLYDPEIEILSTLGFTYWYNPDPNNYQIGDFTFTPFGFERLSNGFEITNLGVTPEGGVFFLNILGPNGFETGEYISYMPRVWSDHGEADIYSTGYGSGSISRVTYPYHRWAGDYELLVTFQYPGMAQELYPFGTGAINYSISEPEWSEEDSQVFICDTNDDGIVSDLELADCQENLEGSFLENMFNFYSGIKTLFRELMKIGQVEKKEWGFFLIPQTHAESMTDRIPLQPGTEDNILTDFYGFFKGFIIFAFLILTVIIIIIILKKSPGST